MIVCLAGNPSIDRWMEIGAVSPGTIHRPHEVVVVPGGKGFNVARAGRSLGASVTATGILAGHAGRWIAAELAAEGVDGRFAWGPGETRSCLSVSDRASGALTEFYEPGAPAGATGWSSLASIVEDLLGSAGWLAMSGSLPAGLPVDGYAQLVRRTSETGVSAAVDTRGPWLEAALEARPALVKVNAGEATELLGRRIDAGAAGDAAHSIRERSGGAVAITLGEDGMVLVDPSGRTWYGSTPARGAYPVGSGDAFLAGMLSALSDGAAWPDAAALGLGAGAANAETPGAGRLDPDRARGLAAAARASMEEISG